MRDEIELSLFLGVLVTLAASLPVGRKPSRARLRRCLVGAGLGGSLAMLLLMSLDDSIVDVSYELADLLARRGFRASVFDWSFPDVGARRILLRIAAGGEVCWWQTRERGPEK